MTDPRRSAIRSVPWESLSVRAERLLDAVMADPRRTRGVALTLLDRARATGDIVAQSIVERAVGLALRAADDAPGAATRLRRSVRLAESAGLTRRAAESRMSLALVLDDLGRPGPAIAEIDRAVADLTGLPRGRAWMQRAIILRRLGREEEALRGYGQALVTFRRHGDRLWVARALTNRGVLLGYRGRLRPAAADLRQAEAIYLELGQDMAVAQVRHNLGFVAAQGGDVPAALAWYDRADEYFRDHGRPAVALIDRAELLLAARLWPEAARAADLAVRSCLRSRLFSLLPPAQLLRAQAALAAGDVAGARQAALTAQRALRRHGRSRWAALARYVLWQTTGRSGGRGHRITPAMLAAAVALAQNLASAGWAVPAMEVRLHAAERCVTGEITPGPARSPALAAATGATMAELAAAVAAPPSGPARLRIRSWYGRALLRLYQQDLAGARRALRTGLAVVDDYRAALGATELRVHSSAEGTPLAVLGLRLALAGGRPREVLTWVERWRAAALRPYTPTPVVPAVTADLARLRQVTAKVSTMDDPAQLGRLLRRQQALEDGIRRRTWQTAAAGTGGRRRDSSVAAICAALDAGTGLGPAGAALLELVEVDATLTALVVADGRVSSRPLGDPAAVAAESAALRFALHRLARGRGGAPSLQAARTGLAHAAGRLDELLLAPVRHLVGDRGLVLVPTGALHALAWPVLPTCRGRPLVVAPSAGLWRAAATARMSTRDDQVLLVAAPAPPYAQAEVAAIARDRRTASVLTGADATAVRVMAALDRAAVAHIAAHGTFRADNPLFSQLSLADGPLTGYDLMTLRRPPAVMILSACEAGSSAVYAGDELMGLTAAMLALGTRSLIASVGPVDDAATAALMVDLHRRLRAGAGPAEALAAAQAATTLDSTAGFICFGAG